MPINITIPAEDFEHLLLAAIRLEMVARPRKSNDKALTDLYNGLREAQRGKTNLILNIEPKP